jgi:hypothetical protein
MAGGMVIAGDRGGGVSSQARGWSPLRQLGVCGLLMWAHEATTMRLCEPAREATPPRGHEPAHALLVRVRVWLRLHAPHRVERWPRAKERRRKKEGERR